MERDRRDSLLKAATDAVRRQSWFESGGWTLSGMDGEGWAGLQLSKSHWFNETGDGIHFETWLAEDTVTSGLLLFQAHVMHGGMTFPGTDKKAGALSRPVIARHRELIKSWGYHILAAPGMTLLSLRIPYEESRFVDDVVREFSRFAVLGDTIDEVLAWSYYRKLCIAWRPILSVLVVTLLIIQRGFDFLVLLHRLQI